MSKTSHLQSHKGRGKGVLSQKHLEHCATPTKAQFDAVRSHLVQTQPGWTFARCRQRALVEAYKQKGSAAA